MNKKNSESAELRKGHFNSHPILEKELLKKWYAMPFHSQETIPQFNISLGMAWICFTLSKCLLHNFPPLSLITPLSKLVFAFALRAAALELQGTRI